jgi:hypothetical protein
VRLTRLSLGQRLGWYFASVGYGVCIAAIGVSADVFSGPAPEFAFAVFFVFWIVGVIGLRFYVQDKDPTSFRSILGLSQTDRHR